MKVLKPSAKVSVDSDLMTCSERSELLEAAQENLYNSESARNRSGSIEQLDVDSKSLKKY